MKSSWTDVGETNPSVCEQELAQKIKGYQEQIASLNSKCKMVSVKAKHATMLLTVSDVEGLPVGLDLDQERAQKAPAVAVTERGSTSSLGRSIAV